jgi:hypothetical protein
VATSTRVAARRRSARRTVAATTARSESGTSATAVATAAVWLDVLCVLAAGALGSYSLAGGRSWAGVGLGVLAVPRAVPAGAGLVARTTADDGDGRRWRVLAAAGVGLVLVVVFGAMFRAADEGIRTAGRQLGS